MAHAEREVDRIEIFEGPRKQREMRREKDQQQRDGGRSRALDGTQPKRLVQAAAAVSAQIDGHVLVAERPQVAIDGLAAPSGSSARDSFVRRPARAGRVAS